MNNIINLNFEDIKDISIKNYYDNNGDIFADDFHNNFLLYDDNDDNDDINLDKYEVKNSCKEISITYENETKEDFDIPGLSGLSNMGNTCYLNAALQSLRNTPVFFSYILKKEYFESLKKNIHKSLIEKKREELKINIGNFIDIGQEELLEECDSSITSLFYFFLVASWGENCEISPKSLKNKLSEYNNEFVGYGQNDSQELIHLFFDRIHEETKQSVRALIPEKSLKRGLDDIIDRQNNIIDIKNSKDLGDEEKKNKFYEYKDYRDEHRDAATILKSYVEWQKFIENGHSIIRDLFTNVTYEKKTCDYCGYSSNMFEYLTTVPIQIPDDTQTLSYNNEIDIYDCFRDYVSVEKMTGDNKLQCSNCNLLYEATKRSFLWETSEYLIIHLMRFKKEYLNGNIHVSKNHSKVIFPFDNLKLNDFYSDVYKPEEMTYNLYSVLMHSGSYSGGHYYSYCKSPINNEWYLFNDSHVEYIPKDKVEEKLITSNAYLLFYQKNTTFE